MRVSHSSRGRITFFVHPSGWIENIRLRAQIDHSGAITISDYYAYVTQQSFGASDATQTTLWSHDDVKAQARENFRSMDLDNDGIVTKQEYVFLSVGLPLRKGRK